jgi:hypothetical protein
MRALSYLRCPHDLNITSFVWAATYYLVLFASFAALSGCDQITARLSAENLKAKDAIKSELVDRDVQDDSPSKRGNGSVEARPRANTPGKTVPSFEEEIVSSKNSAIRHSPPPSEEMRPSSTQVDATSVKIEGKSSYIELSGERAVIKSGGLSNE